MKRPPSLINQCFHFLHFFHFTILLCYHTIMNILPETTTYPEPVPYTLKNLFGINMAYNLSGHPGPRWPKFDIYNLIWTTLHVILKQVPPTSGHSEPGTRINSANYIWALGSNNFTMNQWNTLWINYEHQLQPTWTFTMN